MNLVLDLGTTIKGECTLTDAAYKDKINIQSWAYGASLASYTDGTNQKRTFGKPEVSAISITKSMDLASTGIFQACIAGTNLPTVKIFTLQEESGKFDVFYTITLTNALIESYQVSTGGQVPSESLTLTFSKIELAYKQQTTQSAQSGSKTASFDRTTLASASA
jgi:type VI secretion system secreted protein Hcp